MNKSEILKRLEEGQRIVEKNSMLGLEYYLSFGNDYSSNDRISKSQFEKYKLLCNKVLDEHHKRWLRTQCGYCYYWIDEEIIRSDCKNTTGE